MSAENRENDRAAEATERKSRGSSDEAGLHSNAEGRVAEDDDDVDGASLGGAAGAAHDKLLVDEGGGWFTLNPEVWLLLVT